MRQATGIDYYLLTFFSIDNSEFQHASSSAGNMLEIAKIYSPYLRYLTTSKTQPEHRH
jgi:hypothetical protein